MALELLALRLARDLGLRPIAFRRRSRETGFAEVDLIANGAYLHFSRWLFQCKNQKKNVPLSALAKEIGIATLLRAHVVVVVSTGTFSRDLKEFALQTERTTPLQVVLLSGAELREYGKRGASVILKSLEDQARRALATKRSQLDPVVREE